MKGIRILSRQVDGVDHATLRVIADKLMSRLKEAVIVLGSAIDDKAFLVVTASRSLLHRGVHAGQIVKELSALLDGSGGGRPDMAQGGGKDAKSLPMALGRVEMIIEKMLRSKR